MHAFFINEERKILQFDIIVSFQVKDTKQLLEDITGDIEQEYPLYKVHMNIDHRYS